MTRLRALPWRRIGVWAARAVAAAAAFCVLWVLAYRVVDPPITFLMAQRNLAHGATIDRTAVPLADVSSHLLRAVIAAEDSRFCDHSGFDWDALRAALDETMSGRRKIGGSTITMQTAKNVFLWPDRSLLRKGAEAGFTVLIEALWPKRRILEVYLNVVEWGPGIYGAEAAARHWFGVSAAALQPWQAARLAAVLPSPRRRNPARPSAFVRDQSATIRARMRSIRIEDGTVCP